MGGEGGVERVSCAYCTWVVVSAVSSSRGARRASVHEAIFQEYRNGKHKYFCHVQVSEGAGDKTLKFSVLLTAL